VVRQRLRGPLRRNAPPAARGGMAAAKIAEDGVLSTKSEYRNSKQIQRTEIQMTETLSQLRRLAVLDLKFRSFELVSDFELRISDFSS
jgi:hypothetical protein